MTENRVHDFLKPPPSLLGKGGAASLGSARSDRPVVQDYRPLPESIEWELGQRYLRERGSKAFLHDASPVPYAVNNDGTLSLRAARVLFQSLLEAEERGDLEEEVFVLELGVGVGLFARLFLDAFRALCRERGKDYYERLCYVAGDYAGRMLLDACRHGTFANHPGRYALRVVDALDPEAGLRHGIPPGQAPGRFRAVFLNYLLDCLPATVLKVSDGDVQQLCVRTCLARGVDPAELAGLDPDDLPHKMASDDPDDRRELLAAFPLFASAYDFRPVDLAGVPLGDFAIRFARSTGAGQVLHSHGAIQCLERLLGLLHPRGFILLNDYGQTEAADAVGFEHQRFSGSTFVGLNFPLLRAYFTDAGKHHWSEPPEEEASIHARLLGRQLSPATVECFQALFGKAAHDATQGPALLARALAGAGRLEAAASTYSKALEVQPLNWLLMGEVARFLTFGLQSPHDGLRVAREALALNPACSAELWNALGDALFALGRTGEAGHAFRRAMRINPNDAQAHYNLSFVHAQQKDWPQALQAIAQGLALDAAGQYREGLLQKQQEVLGQLAARHRRDVQLLANRTNACPAGLAADGPAPGPTPTMYPGTGSGGAGNPPGAGPVPVPGKVKS
jgi:tetratricopeptide (TPR) repeat protein